MIGRPEGEMEGKTEMTLKDIVYNLSNEEKERFEEHFDWNYTACGTQDSSAGIPEEDYFPRSDMDFQRLFRIFDKYCNFRRLKLESSELRMRLQKVENYMVGWTLSSHLRELLQNHGDVSEGLELTPEMKSLGFHFLCKVLYGMNQTIVNKITEQHLRDWYGYLKFVTRMGFRIDFVYSKLEKAKQAFFDLRAKDLEAKIPIKLNDKKSDMEKKLAEIDYELQKYKEYRESYARWKKTSKSYSEVGSQLNWTTL